MPPFVTDGDLYTGTVADFSGMDPIIYREPLQTEQYDSMSLNGESATKCLKIINSFLSPRLLRSIVEAVPGPHEFPLPHNEPTGKWAKEAVGFYNKKKMDKNCIEFLRLPDTIFFRYSGIRLVCLKTRCFFYQI